MSNERMRELALHVQEVVLNGGDLEPHRAAVAELCKTVMTEVPQGEPVHILPVLPDLTPIPEGDPSE
jgi:hypothetical protein